MSQRASSPVDCWPTSEANKHGFVSFRFLVREASERTEDEFVALYPSPALWVVDPTKMTTGIRELLAPLDRGFQLLTEKIEGQAFLRYLNKVAFVSKRPGNPYPHLVSVGRSPSNDVTLAVPTVSKVHGYFAFEGDAWGFTDHGSSNGSCLNRRRLKARETYTLGSGDVLRLGPEVNLRFMTPEALYRRARGGG